MEKLLRRWWPVLVLLVLFAALQGKLWLGAGGWRDAKALQRTVEEQRAENARLQQRNDALTAEVEDLKSGETAVEERARSELGMVKPGETFYRVVEPHTPPAPPPAKAPDATGAPAAPVEPVPVAPAPDATAPDAKP